MNHISINFIIKKCKKLFKKKLKDYDLSWKIIKIYSMIDQIFIKVFRIQNIQKRGYQKVKEEKIIDTYIDVINYIVITIIKLNTSNNLEKDISHSKIICLYIQQFNKIKNWKKNIELYNKKMGDPSIEKILEYIFYLKKKKEKILSNNLEKIFFKILKITILLLMKDIRKNK
ncbi:DUF1599 domain-containing protein [Blattabacterium punctulatus]|uniref:DUF1599 domain-containing protein n=1 Tax=Blattabacterium punctulatus TaxID=164514 RepID=UPI000D7C3C6A|nr:DUF1599 domain-containing protein [Blattabacterium punctulatus]AWU42480.1 hypothetical protein DM811_00485 [Blattabacterium punctulatus]AWU43022.1 hypothetical protein DM809_00485 [Blattabacterium punctulatus]AWU45760.1 hypothetical protein DM810_00485 [Blattabacterium punctulatus]